MSHRPERKQKDCLNCGTIVLGKYCQHCGQENMEPKETFGGMVMHFFSDITHFDGKFFTSLKDLLVKPGFLSKEYMKGRRTMYLNPVRMYVFTSAIFFLIFFSQRGNEQIFQVDDTPFTRTERDSLMEKTERKIKTKGPDPKYQKQLELLRDTSQVLTRTMLLPYRDNFHVVGVISSREYNTIHEYDSVQAALPKKDKDGWLQSKWNRRALHLDEKYKHDLSASMGKMSDQILHKLPALLFVSLPFFALILKMLYYRRKNFYYADHGIFSIHHYIFSFILLMFIFLWDKLDDVTGWAVWDWVIFLTVLLWPIYLFIAMRKFYGQSRVKTFFKFFILNILGLLMLGVLFAFFFLFSVFTL